MHGTGLGYLLPHRNPNIEDRLQSSRPYGLGSECLHQLVKNDPVKTTTPLVEALTYHNQPWLSTYVALDFFVHSVEVGSPPADKGAVSALLRDSCFAAVVQEFQNLSQLPCHGKRELGSLRQCSTQNIVEPTG